MTPLDTQTAAPPIVPPHRPIVTVAMDDGDDFHAQLRVLAAKHAELQAALSRLRDRLDG